MRTFNQRQQKNTGQATATLRFVPRSQPRAFRKTRILIVGCGQVGEKLLQLYPNLHFIATYQPKPGCNAKRLHLQHLKAQTFALNHQNKSQLQRAVTLARRIVWLAPPNPQGRQQELLHVCLYARWHHQRHGGTAPRIGYVSTTGVYGNTQGATVNERSPIQAQSARALRRVHAEQHLRQQTRRIFAHSQARIHTHLMRAPGIYSNQRLPLERLRQGLPAICEQEDAWSNHIHEVDLARLCLWAQFKSPCLDVINACDQHPCRMGEYFDLVADWAKLPRPPRLPKIEVQHHVSPMVWSFMQESRRVVSSRQKQLGFVLRYPSVKSALGS